MANTPQAEKRIRRNARRAEINKARVSRIRTFVKRAESALDSLETGSRPIGINAVSLSQRLPGTAAEPGFWAEWTRACCDRRRVIEDFEDPLIEQFEREGSHVTRQLKGEHLESQLRVLELEHPTEHVGE